VRSTLSDCLVRAAEADERIIVLTGDHGYALFDEFRARFSDRFVNAGIAEQNMIGIAAGMARSGYRPIVYGLSAFIPVRVLEQIKLDIAHDRLPVLLLGDGAGFVYSYLGTSHQSLEDVACTRPITGLSVLSPCDRFELRASFELALRREAPTYMRLGKADLGDVHDGPVDIDEGDLIPVREGRPDGFTVIATGSMVPVAVDIAESSRPDLSIWSAPSIKPLDGARLTRLSERSRGIIVMEEHSIIGGLGSAVCELLADRPHPPVLRIGCSESFSHTCGSYEHLRREHGLDARSVLTRIEEFSTGLDHGR